MKTAQISIRPEHLASCREDTIPKAELRTCNALFCEVSLYGQEWSQVKKNFTTCSVHAKNLQRSFELFIWAKQTSSISSYTLLHDLSGLGNMTLHQIKTAEINSAVITGAGKKKGREGMFSVQRGRNLETCRRSSRRKSPTSNYTVAWPSIHHRSAYNVLML